MNNFLYRFERQKHAYRYRMRGAKKMHESPSASNNIYYRNFSFLQKLEPKRFAKSIARKTRLTFEATAPAVFEASKKLPRLQMKKKFQPILFTATNPRHSIQLDYSFFQQDSMNLQNL